VIFYQHIYKNGGSTIRDNCIRQGVGVNVKLRNGRLYERDGMLHEWNLLSNSWPVYFGYIPVQVVRDQIPTVEKFTTTVRDPINRLMSGYNYFLHHCWLSYGTARPKISFMVWFVNREIIAPIVYRSQIDLIGETNSYTFDYFNNRTLTVDEVEENMPAWTQKYNDYMMFKADQTFSHLDEFYDDVFILEDNYVRNVTDYFKYHNIELDVQTRENTGKHNRGSPNVKFTDLTEQEKHWVRQWNQAELYFYNECKDRYSKQ
jgi:hypothetical protein